jgi:hypothetical protein
MQHALTALGTDLEGFVGKALLLFKFEIAVGAMVNVHWHVKTSRTDYIPYQIITANDYKIKKTTRDVKKKYKLNQDFPIKLPDKRFQEEDDVISKKSHSPAGI